MFGWISIAYISLFSHVMADVAEGLTLKGSLQHDHDIKSTVTKNQL